MACNEQEHIHAVHLCLPVNKDILCYEDTQKKGVTGNTSLNICFLPQLVVSLTLYMSFTGKHSCILCSCYYHICYWACRLAVTTVHIKRLWLIIQCQCSKCWPPLWSSCRSSLIQLQRSQVRFLALPHFLRSCGSGTGSNQPREYNWGATWMEK
jgi:hypothetical protein